MKCGGIATLDLETDPFRFERPPKAFDAGFFDGETHYEFWGADCCSRLVDLLLNYKGKVYAHNGGKFDFHFLMPYIPDEATIFIINGRIVRLKFAECVLLDSYSILPVPLRASGGKIDIAYWKLEAGIDCLSPQELAEFEADKAKANSTEISPREFYRAEIIKYRRQDNEALHKLVSAFVDTYGNGLTLANRAFNELKKLELKPSPGNERMDRVLRPFYFGGRVECFRPGIHKGGFKIIDINSAYPAAMMKKHFWGADFIALDRLPKSRDKVAVSFITLECVSKGAFPLRVKGGGLSFPHGKHLFKVSGWEFLAALDTKTISEVRIIECLVPYETRDFVPYVEKFFALKLKAEQDGDTQQRLFAKLMLNSAYGKFAVNPEKFRENRLCPVGDNPNDEAKDELGDNERGNYPDCEAKENDVLEWELVSTFDDWGFCLWEKPVEQSKKIYYHVGTAASITGFVRAFLWRSINQVKNPVYCDTDSIICEDTADLKLSSDLGDWKLEAEGNSVAIAGKKLYSFRCNDGKFKIASKGVRVSPQEIYRVAQGEEIQWRNIAPSFSLKSEPKFISRKIRKTV